MISLCSAEARDGTRSQIPAARWASVNWGPHIGVGGVIRPKRPARAWHCQPNYTSDTDMWNQLIQLSFRSKVGLQAQIREMLVTAILDGHIPVGVALPSTRVLAAQLGVARNTVALAYELLVNEGYLLTKSRSGHYVNPEIIAGRVGLPRAPGVGNPPSPVDWTPRLRGGVSAQRNIVKPRDWQRYPVSVHLRAVRSRAAAAARMARVQPAGDVGVRGARMGRRPDRRRRCAADRADPDAAARAARRVRGAGRNPGDGRRAACAVPARDVARRRRHDRRHRESRLSRCAQHLRVAHGEHRAAAARRRGARADTGARRLRLRLPDAVASMPDQRHDAACATRGAARVCAGERPHPDRGRLRDRARDSRAARSPRCRASIAAATSST